MFVCDICNRGFARKASLTMHKNWHNPSYKALKQKQIRVKWQNVNYKRKVSKYLVRLKLLHIMQKHMDVHIA